MIKFAPPRAGGAAFWAIIGLIFTAVGSFWWVADLSSRGKAVPARPKGRPAAPKPLDNFPPVLPVEYLPLSREDALKQNEAYAAIDNIGPVARAFHISGDPVSRARATRCLTEAVYYEAASQDLSGQRAVAQVVLNRVRHPAFPATVCGVVYQGSERATGCQFTFTCDGALSRPMLGPSLARARLIATRALAGYVSPGVGNATHYHADWVVPYWASSLARATKIGVHIFYRWKGPWGRPLGFSQNYAGQESDPIVAPIALANITVVTEKAPAAGGDHINPNQLVLAEDLRTQGLVKSSELGGRQMLKADEIKGSLILSLQTKPAIQADGASLK